MIFSVSDKVIFRNYGPQKDIENLRPAQMHPTFHPTSKIFDVGWNVRSIWELSKFRKK